MGKVYLRNVQKKDITYIKNWWNDPDNFGATGIKESISYEEVLFKFNNRYNTDPYEEWFAICLRNVDQPIGIIIIAPNHPKDNMISIGSIIIDKNYRRNGYALEAMRKLEERLKINYSGLTLSLGVFEDFKIAKSFWDACGFEMFEKIETDYIYQGKKQNAYKYRKKLK